MKFASDLLIVMKVVVTFLSLFNIIVAENVEIVELSQGWTLTNQNNSQQIQNVKVPSGVYSALYDEKVLLSKNDVNMRWIARDNWTYTYHFSISAQTLEKECCAFLTFHGIDTVSEIHLNHDLLGRTDNMFVRYSYDVTKKLQQENTLEVQIFSPITVAKTKATDMKNNNKHVPPDCPPSIQNGECNINMLRKMQASFSWDWGLAAPSMGIWKPVALEYYKVAMIRDIDVITSKNESHWNMQVRVYLDVGGKKNFFAELKVYTVELFKEVIVIDKFKNEQLSYKNAFILFEQAIPIENVIPWWPNGHGPQKLYPFYFTLNAWLNKSGPNVRAKTISKKSIRVGFRTIELVEEPVEDETGNTFLFKVNGQEIFMKGSNYIPSHILPELSNDHDRIKHLLKSAKDANMNMLRVWGGGVYESDYFYDMADEYGLLIWQDMMFACAMYPAVKDFLQSVSVEVKQNALRIGHHACIAIFAGNNENEQALVGGWFDTDDTERFYAEYRMLYVGTVLHELKILEHSARPHPLVSSPSNGKESEKDNYISENPGDSHYGDVHFYNYQSDGWSSHIYPRPRFASEYGFQSLPAMESWKRVMFANDTFADIINHRQHSEMGNINLRLSASLHLPLPQPSAANYEDALIYFSQIDQAMSIKTETELYRSLRDTPIRTMGALYWQLNDVWVAPTWSSIDFFGNYKLLQYWSRDFMASYAIVALPFSGFRKYTDPNELQISLICDELNINTDNIQVVAYIYKWSSLSPKCSKSWPATLKANGVHYDKVITISNLWVNGYTKNNSFIEFVLQQNNTTLAKNYFFPESIKNAIGVMNPEIEVKILSKNCMAMQDTFKNSYSLTVTVKYPAIFVYLEVTDSNIVRYTFSKNGFMQVIPVTIVHLEFEHNSCLDLNVRNIKILTVNQFMQSNQQKKSSDNDNQQNMFKECDF